MFNVLKIRVNTNFSEFPIKTLNIHKISVFFFLPCLYPALKLTGFLELYIKGRRGIVFLAKKNFKEA